ncbi:kynurenine 3-monooxygenase, mitochondrial precursor [Coemansia erecta]|uniref:Kynurenine 3-monooxygenase n=1 Tax=Coemansia erecta TaxID=147472 RepID=A0A9W8CVV5_9FUNG|nr:kynurenine 3-monooxygenase, mitochondrial precursor [Coemansia erecta]
MSTERSVVIVGGGLVGSLTACYFAKRGWRVDLLEKRPDIRLPENAHLVEHRSINLAISERGFSALRRLNPDLERQVKALVVPMHGRMIHALDGRQTSQAYDVFGRHINSVGRSTLIKILLDTVSSYSLATLHFNHEFLEADLDSGRVAFIDDKGQRQEITADLMVGADGAYSKVRQRMMARVKMNYSQKYIEHGYCEFSMPALNGAYAMDPNHLHIWPRGSFMLIALPNMDKTFTCTLFMPWSQFDQVKSEDQIAAFFQSNFPDALELMGEKSVRSEYAKNPKGSLMYIKCTPYTYKGRAVILGDAAHAMVPFYGQGMNCGFEDVEALDGIMLRILHEKTPDSDHTCALSESQMQRALDEYSCTRTSDASAIVDLALENYIEMRARVVDYAYLFRKKLEGILHRVVPTAVIPLYTMVSFTSIPYSTVVRQWNRQTKWLHRSIWTLSAMTAIGTGVLAARLFGLLTEYPSGALAGIVAKARSITS